MTNEETDQHALYKLYPRYSDGLRPFSELPLKDLRSMGVVMAEGEILM